MSVFTPLETSINGGRKMVEKSTKKVQAQNILEAIQKSEQPHEVVSANREMKIHGTPYHNYVLKLERVV